METKERCVKFDFDIIKGRGQYMRIDFYHSRMAEYVAMCNDFNRLVERNRELAMYDPKLTDLQKSVIAHLTSQL